MWLKRLVGVMMIVTLVGMNALVIVGLLVKPPPLPKPVVDVPVVTVPTEPPPTIELKVEPAKVPANTTSALSWTTTGSPTECLATGTWSGNKTMFGAESTGRLGTPGNYEYKLTCSNKGGKAEAVATVTVGNAIAPPKSVVATSTPSPAPSGGGGSTFCGGRVPCYSRGEVGGHGSSGNCWGWNGDRVLNISGFDAAFHQAKTGISSITVSGICGADMAGAINGSVGASGAPGHAHLGTTKSNSDRNEIPYFVGYYDASKP